MSTEHAIIVILSGLLFTLCTFVVGILLWIGLSRPKKGEPPGKMTDDFEASYELAEEENTSKKGEPPGKMTDDCAEFYLDLHRYATDAGFTKEEAERLYKVWQRWIGKKYNVRALKAEKRDESNNTGGN